MHGVEMSKGSKFNCLLFDLDDTLYPLSSGINLACRKNIQEYMLNHLHIEETQVPKMCLDFYKEYGTTMAGLKMIGYDFDDDEFHKLVHGELPYDALRPDPILRNLLLSTPQRKIIFTNADKAHVARALSRLGLEDCFDGVICFETLNSKPSRVENGKSHDIPNNGDGINQNPKILCKPSIEAIEAAIRIANIDPNRTLFFDDSARNIASGKAAGLHTVITDLVVTDLVDGEMKVGSSEVVEGADHALSSIHNMKEALPEIWEGDGEGADHIDQVFQSSHVETEVLA